MSTAIDQIVEQIKSLPRADQMRIVERVYAEDVEVDPAFDAVCLALANERKARLERGETTAIPVDEAIDRIRRGEHR